MAAINSVNRSWRAFRFVHLHRNALSRQADYFAPKGFVFEIQDAKSWRDGVEAELGRVDTELDGGGRCGQQLQVADPLLAFLMHVTGANCFDLRGTGGDLQQRLRVSQTECVDPGGTDIEGRMMYEQDRWLLGVQA